MRAASIFALITLVSVAGFCAVAYLLRDRVAIFDRDDPLGYYLYCRSLLHDGDLNFQNEFQYFRNQGSPLGVTLGDPDPVTKLPNNYYTIGFPLGAGPVYAIFSGLLCGDSHNFPWFLDQFIFSCSGLLLGIIGLWFSYKFVSLHFLQQESALATGIFWACSPLIYYFSREPFQSHLGSIFAVSLFLYVWKRRWTSESARHFLMGVSGGLMIVTREQDALVLLVPAGHWLLSHKKTIPDRAQLFTRPAIFVCGFLIALSLQIWTWKILRGEFLSFSHRGGTFSNWAAPHLFDVFLSSNHGLFAWHPLTAICVAGLIFSRKLDPAIKVPAVLCLVGEAYVIASWWMWWLGHSFGNRGLMSLTPLFILGLTAIISSLQNPTQRSLFFGLCALFFIWNLILVAAYLSEMIPYQGEFSWIDFLTELSDLPSRVAEKIGRL